MCFCTSQCDCLGRHYNTTDFCHDKCKQRLFDACLTYSCPENIIYISFAGFVVFIIIVVFIAVYFRTLRKYITYRWFTRYKHNFTEEDGPQAANTRVISVRKKSIVPGRVLMHLSSLYDNNLPKRKSSSRLQNQQQQQQQEEMESIAIIPTITTELVLSPSELPNNNATNIARTVPAYLSDWYASTPPTRQPSPLERLQSNSTNSEQQNASDKTDSSTSSSGSGSSSSPFVAANQRQRKLSTASVNVIATIT